MTSRPVHCEHWSDCGVRNGGCCALGLHQGRPSHGSCASCSGQRSAPHKQGLVKLGAAYLRAELSLLWRGPVADDVHDARLTACRSCEHRRDHPEDSVGLCARCSCAGSSRARLGVRAWMPDATCPVDRFGASPGTGRHRLDADHGAANAATIARHLLTQIRARRARRPTTGADT